VGRSHEPRPLKLSRADTSDKNRCSPLSSHATTPRETRRADASFGSQPAPVAGTSRVSPPSNPDATSPRSTSARRIYQAPLGLGCGVPVAAPAWLRKRPGRWDLRPGHVSDAAGNPSDRFTGPTTSPTYDTARTGRVGDRVPRSDATLGVPICNTSALCDIPGVARRHNRIVGTRM
jgi:hypothetical protein